MKRYKQKKSSCGMCKPHKRGWSDRRNQQWRKADEGVRVDRDKEQ